MRSLLALGLLIALGTSADAAPVHHQRVRHHVFISPRAASSFAAVPVWGDQRTWSPAYQNDTPSYHDASKYGGSTALSAE